PRDEEPSPPPHPRPRDNPSRSKPVWGPNPPRAPTAAVGSSRAGRIPRVHRRRLLLHHLAAPICRPSSLTVAPSILHPSRVHSVASSSSPSLPHPPFCSPGSRTHPSRAQAPPTETRPAEGAEALANGAREPEEPAPEVEEEEAEEEPPRSATAKQEEAKAALGAEGSRPFTMQELLGELKEDGEAAGSGSSARSAFGDGNGIGSADAEGSSYRKYEEICPVQVEELCYVTDNSYTKEEVLQLALPFWSWKRSSCNKREKYSQYKYKFVPKKYCPPSGSHGRTPTLTDWPEILKMIVDCSVEI
ncbi:unnamed protein product, partial [Urochloa humidicola]